MDTTQMAQVPAPAVDVTSFVPPEISLWTLFWDPAFAVILAIAALIALASVWQPAARRFAKKQTDYLDHQQDMNEKTLAQNKAMEDLIAKQYAESNARSDKALEQAVESLRLHSEAVEQLKGMNAAIVRLSALIEAQRGGRPA